MAITSTTMQRVGRVTNVTVVSDLGSIVYYHWYVNGSYVGQTLVPYRTFVLDDDEQADIDTNDTNDADYDAVANAPEGYPSRRTIFWTASPDADVAYYLVEQKKDAEDWATIATVANDGSWSFTLTTLRLTDLADYQWRVTPYDAAGNAGDAITIGPETVVRVPDGPVYELAFDDDTQLVTYSEA